MIRSYFESMVAGLQAKLEAAAPEHLARKRFALEVARLGQRLFTPEEQVCWCGVLAPFDVLAAMGVTSCFVEFVGALLSSTDMVGGYLGAAEEAGYSTDACSYHRAVMGAALGDLVPEPRFLIATSAPCTGGLAVIENLARRFDKDLFMLHVPHHHDERAVRFLAAQLHDMVEFVAAHTGAPLDRTRLAEAIDRTNRARALLVEAYELARAVPSPARPRDFVNLGIVFALLMGSEAGVEVARTYRDELARKVAAGVAGVPGERVRLLWLQNRIQFRSAFDELLDRSGGVAIVADELNDVTWDPIDPEDPFPGLAARMLSVAFVGPATRRLERLKYLARAYRVDGALNPCHWGCRQGAGSRGLIAAGLKEIGVPVLNLEVDCVDPRNFAEGQLRTRFEAFLEMITAARAARGESRA